jgi:ferrous iron transport protein B
MAPIRVALVGNPNAGKSTLFNALSGLRQQVGNYPGVTVEMKKGRFSHEKVDFELIDLPGTYSLAARSPDELVAVNLLLGRLPGEPLPDVILAIVDASNLERHLYLTTQLLELDRPVVVAVNMIDVAESQGIHVDCAKLSEQMKLPCIPIQAHKGIGLDQLRHVLIQAKTIPPERPKLPEAFEQEAAELAKLSSEPMPLFLARRLLLDVGGVVEKQSQLPIAEARTRLEVAGLKLQSLEARTRYAWIRQVTATAMTKPKTKAVTISDRLDKVLLHRVWGTLLFMLVMFLMFQSIFVWAEPLMKLIDSGTNGLKQLLESSMSAGPVRSLISDGVLGGVGGVVKFLPQILILFGFIAILEECGYMARAAFLMDRLMSRCGLNGKSFIPLLSSVACAVPGIMATRVIENRRDRLATILVAPLMSCSARLPVYGILIAAFLQEGFPFWLPGLVLFGMYLVGFIVAPVVALILKRTLLKGDTPLFVMELPAYKRPTIRGVVLRMLTAGWEFLRRAGTLILASMILIWALLYFPSHDSNGVRYEDRISAAEEAKEDKLVAQINAEWKSNSYLGQVGKSLEWSFRPLGWDWKIGMAVLASFPAREVIVGTLGIIYEEGDQAEEEVLSATIREQWGSNPLHGKYTVSTAISVMVFFALCCQCVSTLAVIRRETQSWSWPLFTFVYMTLLAYLAALFVFQLGRFITNQVA